MIYLNDDFGLQNDAKADEYLSKAYRQEFPEMTKVAQALLSDGSGALTNFPKLAKAMADMPLEQGEDGQLAWPRDEMEVITVTSPPLETVLREQLISYRRPVKTTGTRFTGKRCAERVACFASDGVEGMSDYSFLFISYSRIGTGGGNGRL